MTGLDKIAEHDHELYVLKTEMEKMRAEKSAPAILAAKNKPAMNHKPASHLMSDDEQIREIMDKIELSFPVDTEYLTSNEDAVKRRGRP